MNAYQKGLVTPTREIVSESIATWRGRLSAYREGLGDAAKGAKYFAARGTRGVVGVSQPAQRAANFVISTVHVGLLVGGLAALAKV